MSTWTGRLRKTVDCFSPRSTSCEVFVYLKTGLDPNNTHTIKIVTKGEKNPNSEGTAIGHIAFEYSAESHKASAGFCSLMGKNHWYYQQRKGSQDSDMQFIPRDDVFVKDWFGEGESRIGNDYQIPGRQRPSRSGSGLRRTAERFAWRAKSRWSRKPATVF